MSEILGAIKRCSGFIHNSNQWGYEEIDSGSTCWEYIETKIAKQEQHIAELEQKLVVVESSLEMACEHIWFNETNPIASVYIGENSTKNLISYIQKEAEEKLQKGG